MHENIISYLKTIGREPDNELFDTLNIKEGGKMDSFLETIIDSPFLISRFVFTDTQVISKDRYLKSMKELEKRNIEFEEDDKRIPLCCDHKRENSFILGVHNTLNEYFIRIYSPEPLIILQTHGFINISEEEQKLYTNKFRTRYENNIRKNLSKGMEIGCGPSYKFSSNWFNRDTNPLNITAACSHCMEQKIKENKAFVALELRSKIKDYAAAKWISYLQDNLIVLFKKYSLKEN